MACADGVSSGELVGNQIGREHLNLVYSPFVTMQCNAIVRWSVLRIMLEAVPVGLMGELRL